MDVEILLLPDEEPIRAIERFFTEQGYLPRPGAKFGGDLVVYGSAGPGLSHSRFLVLIVHEPINWREVIGFSRVAGQVAKEALIALPLGENRLRLMTVERYSQK